MDFAYSLRTFPDFSVNFPVFVGCYPDFCTLEVGRYDSGGMREWVIQIPSIPILISVFFSFHPYI